MTDIDREAAEKVMGWGWVSYDGVFVYLMDDGRLRPPSEWSPSTRINDAWEVVEKLKKDGYNVTIGNDSETWDCLIFTEGPPYRWQAVDIETAPLAICKAALEAVK